MSTFRQSQETFTYRLQDIDQSSSSFSQSFISRLHRSISQGHHFSDPLPTLIVDESDLVLGVLQMLQGFSSSLFYWDNKKEEFHIKIGIHVTHLSQASLHGILNRFVFSGTCLKLVELFVKKVSTSNDAIPTLRAFAGCISSWLQKLRDISLDDEIHSRGPSVKITSTLLQLGSSISSVCLGAEYLLEIVYGSVPYSYFECKASVPASEFAAYILDHLFLKLNHASLIEDGKEYHMLVAIFIGTTLPYIDRLHSWLYDGILDDPYNEMFFSANPVVSIDQSEFWEKGYLFKQPQCKPSLRASLLPSDQELISPDKRESAGKQSENLTSSMKDTGHNYNDATICPLFLKDIAKSIVSAGKSLQIVQHVHVDSFPDLDRDHEYETDGGNYSRIANLLANMVYEVEHFPVYSNSPKCQDKMNANECDSRLAAHLQKVLYNQGSMRMLALSEIFLLSLVSLIGDGRKIHEYLAKPCLSYQEVLSACEAYVKDQMSETENCKKLLQKRCENWFLFMIDIIVKKTRLEDLDRGFNFLNKKFPKKSMGKQIDIKDDYAQKSLNNQNDAMDLSSHIPDFYPENPNLSINRSFLLKNKECWSDLNIFRNFQLPPFNDIIFQNSILHENDSNLANSLDMSERGAFPTVGWLNLTCNPKFRQSEEVSLEDNTGTLASIFPFPTFLPCFQENVSISNRIPFQTNTTLASNILHWLQSSKPMSTPLPTVMFQECLVVYINKQVDCVGRHILPKLMNDWNLMKELDALRAIYLLGSGDLLQQFLLLTFDKLDKGEALDDDFELNTMLQVSIRNSADCRLLSSPDSLFVKIAQRNTPDDGDDDDGVYLSDTSPTPCKVHKLSFGIDALDLLKFVYKVSWPLDFIVKMEAVRKYNQVMCFLLKVKRAKFALDKARRWMWKCKGKMTYNKHHLLVQQKLLHFVDAFHQYVMDRVFHTAWLELCNAMTSAGTLDKIIDLHEAYLLSVQRQCFVAPDKLWALIASRIKVILGLALDFYSVQQTLVSGGATSPVKARCEAQVDRIEKEFDDCISFLLRILSFKLNVGHFPHLADLVTRINYNHFYMSDNGNLLTRQNFDMTSTRLPKPLPT